MIKRIPEQTIRETTSIKIHDISEHDRDEMAIPSYLHKNPFIKWLMYKRYDVISDYLASSNTSSALEFGCGIGLFLEQLCDRFSKVYAIDLFPQYAIELTKRSAIDVQFVKDLDDIEDESLNTIVAADVLEHIDNLETVLKSFHKKLESSGILIVSGPTENFAYKIGRMLAGFGDKGDYHHTNIDNLISDISSNNFRLLEISTLPISFLPSLFKICLFKKEAS